MNSSSTAEKIHNIHEAVNPRKGLKFQTLTIFDFLGTALDMYTVYRAGHVLKNWITGAVKLFSRTA